MQSEWGCLADRGTPGTVGRAMFGGPAVGVLTHRIHGAAIYGNIYHQYTPLMLAYIYIPYMEHMGDSFIDSKKTELVDGGLGRTVAKLMIQVAEKEVGKLGS